MEFTYDIFPDQRMILARYAGRFSFADLKTAAERLWADPRYSESYDGLVDISDGSVAVEMGDFRQLVQFVKGSAKTSRGRWAAVAVSPLATAIAMFYQKSLAGRHTFEVFSTRESACRFLGIGLAVPNEPPQRLR